MQRPSYEIISTRDPASPDAFLSFDSEVRLDSPPPGPEKKNGRGPRIAWMVLFLPALIVIALAGVGARSLVDRSAEAGGPPPAGPVDATVVIRSFPEGANVVVNGVARGQTPVRLTLSAGSHLLRIDRPDRQLQVPLVVEDGVSATHYFHFPDGVSLQSAR